MGTMRFGLLTGLALAMIASTRVVSAEDAASSGCSSWSLDGYRLGMGGEEILAVRSVTIHVWGQAQVIEPGTLHGALVLDASNHLEKWEAAYDRKEGDQLRAELTARFGEPSSDVSGNVIDDTTDTVRQRRAIWRSTSCDAAIIVYENTSVRGARGHTVHATLVRASALPQGLIEMKTLFP
jgi:hypothetical protein